MIDFASIPINLRAPGTYIEIAAGPLQGLSEMPNRILILGQMLGTGTWAPSVPVLISTGVNAVAGAGRGSQLANMIQASLAANPFTETWAIPLADNGAGTATVNTVTITGPSTGNATAQIYVNGTQVQFPVTAGESATAMATALAAAINALPDLAFTAASALGVVTLTARHKGADAGYCDLRATLYNGDAIPAGVAFAFANTTPGAGNPVLTTALANIAAASWFRWWVMPFTDATSTTAADAAIEGEWGPLVMRDGLIFTASGQSYGSLATFGAGFNEKLLSIMGVQNPPQPPYIWAAVNAAQAAYYAGIDPARPLQDIPLPGIVAPAVADRFILSERNTLLYDGISTYRVDDGGNVLMDRLITTYQTNPGGQADASFLSVETLATLAYLRYDLRTYIPSVYPRFKIGDDGQKIGAGQAITTPKLVANTIVARARLWEAAGLITNVAPFKAALVVERDATNPDRVNALIPVKEVGQFRIFAGQLQFTR